MTANSIDVSQEVLWIVICVFNIALALGWIFLWASTHWVMWSFLAVLNVVFCAYWVVSLIKKIQERYREKARKLNKNTNEKE